MEQDTIDKNGKEETVQMERDYHDKRQKTL